ncbi:ribonuclease P protein component [Sinosporangium album]|uniref:ribonuclease P protein component n=1 Tax=Sinosporangium album TaxID=504805 RepID=UPI000B84D278|nr:ribonuclease P protein component [Sinosporangium album]
MLPRGSRMRRGEDFSAAVRKGGRVGRPTLVAHLRLRDDVDQPALVGFVVSRAVGGAVDRNKVKRRLRHLMRDRLEQLPRGSLLVVRANPPAASARSERLAVELDAALDRLLRRRGSGRQTPRDGH